MNLRKTYDQLNKKNAISQKITLTFLHSIVCIYRKNLVKLQDCFNKLHVKIYENLTL